MSYRNDDDALRALREDLEREETRVADALSRVRQDLADREARRAPVRLANLKVASPCHEDWNAMTGDERARHCASCNLTVFNLSSMTTEDAETLLAAHHTRLCVRFYQRADGTVITTDCPVGGRRKRRRMKIAASAMAAGAAIAGLGAALSGGRSRKDPALELQGALIPAPIMGAAEPPPESLPPPPPPVTEVKGQMIRVDPPSTHPHMNEPVRKKHH
jgi:hypothetical protein